MPDPGEISYLLASRPSTKEQETIEGHGMADKNHDHSSSRDPSQLWNLFSCTLYRILWPPYEERMNNTIKLYACMAFCILEERSAV